MTHEDYLEIVRERIKQYTRVNLLSPAQEKDLLKLDFDTSFLEDEIREHLKKADIPYLKKLLLPKKCVLREPKIVSAAQIMQGIIAGDIIGSEYEFSEHDYASVCADGLTSEKSRFTDDSVLALATKKAIRKNLRRPNYRKAYLEAYTEYPDVGYGGAYIRWAKGKETSNRKGYNSYGNGSAIRAAIIGAEYDDVREVVKQAIRSACVTHDHQYGIIGAAVTAVVVWMARNSFSKTDIKEYVSRFYCCSEADKEFLVDKDMYFDFNAELDNVPNNVSRNSLFCAYAVPFAVKCFLETNSYAECMAKILRHYGDTDTLCAIAGGICVAYYGEMNLSLSDFSCVQSASMALSHGNGKQNKKNANNSDFGELNPDFL